MLKKPLNILELISDPDWIYVLIAIMLCMGTVIFVLRIFTKIGTEDRINTIGRYITIEVLDTNCALRIVVTLDNPE